MKDFRSKDLLSHKTRILEVLLVQGQLTQQFRDVRALGQTCPCSLGSHLGEKINSMATREPNSPTQGKE